MTNIQLALQQHICDNTTLVVLSKSKDTVKKIIARQYVGKQLMWQIEKHTNTQVFHSNVTGQQLVDTLLEVANNYSQINITNTDSQVQLLVNKKGQVHTTKTAVANDRQPTAHNRQKQYILTVGSDIPALRELGIFDNNNQLIKSKSDKYRQINRFVEIIDHQMRHYNKDSIVVLDYGCGKSYLTFLVYHYFAVVRNINITVYGYDVKTDVVQHCNQLAQKYHYDNLHFVVADVTKDTLQQDVDMIITLHACDTATDYALFHAITHNVDNVFCVPCCQHEINNHISTTDHNSLLLADGLVKERFCSLLTDSIRVDILRQCGYQVDVVELVDFQHSPKNLMIRAQLKKPCQPNLDRVEMAICQYNTNQTLYRLVSNYYRNR